MSKRRSRSQHPQKARHSEAPRPQVPITTGTGDRGEAVLSDRPSASRSDELAALDAGWDDL
jgi:hypothetical protein